MKSHPIIKIQLILPNSLVSITNLDTLAHFIPVLYIIQKLNHFLSKRNAYIP